VKATTCLSASFRREAGGRLPQFLFCCGETYARSARAFFHWLVRRGTLEHNPFDRVVFPKVGRPLIQTISDEEFEKLLLACAPPNETGPSAERAAVRNRAILWLLYDTGIRVSELINLRVDDLDRKKGVVTVMGKGSKERRIALGQNCLRNLSYYLDKHRPDGEDHLFLSETRQPLTKNGMEMLFFILILVLFCLDFGDHHSSSRLRFPHHG